MRLPDRRFTVAVLRRATFLWVGIRVIAAMLGMASGGSPIVLTPRAALLVALIVSVLGWLDARRRNEDLFWANLGVAPWMFAALSGAPALSAEALVLWISRW